ncbi:SH3-domain-containing protein [Aulographum hederae CBS 113979]|uniref:SH3-domain-containing protein n=1 Tax=Aulographum hederae CBS 113979 TaxID=1176131 RepID=A0A6G1H988_9PEZI|nr:SH3-domain-containing protein [Aulographum hederae CBS 113979]
MEFNKAMTNRSLRTVKAELEFLADSGVITPNQFTTILSNLPTDSASRASTPATAMSNLSIASPPPGPPPQQANTYNEKTNTNGFANEKQNSYYDSPPTTQPPPPAYPSYPSTPLPPVPLTHASALYAYNPADAGDLALSPNDRVAVTEYMNAEWWKGKNERTGMEGIFPRSYVKVVEEKGAGMAMPPPMASTQSNYGNMPLDVSQSGGSEPGKPSKVQEGGKKFGKKLGNAAVFGAGATIGSNIVNSIF